MFSRQKQNIKDKIENEQAKEENAAITPARAPRRKYVQMNDGRNKSEEKTDTYIQDDDRPEKPGIMKRLHVSCGHR